MEAIPQGIVNLISSTVTMGLFLMVLLLAFGFMTCQLFGNRPGTWLLSLFFAPVRSCLGSAAKGMLGCLGIIFVASLILSQLFKGIGHHQSPPQPPAQQIFDPTLIVSLGVEPASPVLEGTPIKLSARCTRRAHFSFMVKDSVGILTTLSPSFAGDTSEWIPAASGNYSLLLQGSDGNRVSQQVQVDIIVTPKPTGTPRLVQNPDANRKIVEAAEQITTGYENNCKAFCDAVVKQAGYTLGQEGTFTDEEFNRGVEGHPLSDLQVSMNESQPGNVIHIDKPKEKWHTAIIIGVDKRGESKLMVRHTNWPLNSAPHDQELDFSQYDYHIYAIAPIMSR